MCGGTCGVLGGLAFFFADVGGDIASPAFIAGEPYEPQQPA